jgi:outer membrane protein TolC
MKPVGGWLLGVLASAVCCCGAVAQVRPAFQSPQYVTPESPVPYKDPAPRDPTLPINLPTALKLVNVRAMDIAIASQRVAQAGALLEQAKYAWLPTIAMGGDYLRHTGRVQDVAGGIIDPHRSSFMAGLGVNAIFTPADAIFAPLAARQVARARVADVEAATNNSLLTVAEAYFNVQQARGELAGADVVARHAGELANRTEKLTQGISAPVEAVRARAEFARRKQVVQLNLERWRLASTELNRVLRLDPNLLIDPIEPPQMRVSLIPLEQPLDTLIPLGLRYRPELASQQAFVEATLQRLRQERMRPLIPSIVLKGPATNPPAGLTTGVFGGGHDSLSKYGMRTDVEVQVFWEFQNLLFGNAAKIHERKAENQIAMLELFRLQDRIAAEIAQAYAQAISAAARLADSEAGLRDAADSVDKNFQGMKQTRAVGDLVILVVRPQEVVASIQSLAQAYADYYGATADFNRAQFRLYRALGQPADGIERLCAPVTSGILPSPRR